LSPFSTPPGCAFVYHLIKKADFTSITNLHVTYYKCFSCHRIHNEWQLADDPWKIHAQYSPYCSHVTTWKTKFFAKYILQQNPDKMPRYRTYHRFLQQQIRCFSSDVLRLELGQIVNPGNTLTLLQHLTMTSEIFSKILQYFSKTPPEDPQQHTDNQIANLKQRIQCKASTKNETLCYFHANIL